MRELYVLIFFIFIYSATSPAYGSASGSDSLRLQIIEGKLAAASQSDPAFHKEVDLSIGKISLPEMLRNIAKVSGVNLTVKGADGIMVSVNFSRARVADLLFYLCREYDLDIDVVGNIVSIYPLALPQPPPREIAVRYDSIGGMLDFDLLGDNLMDVAKKITALSKNNIIVSQQLGKMVVWGYVEQMPFGQAIETLAEMNGLTAEINGNGVWVIAHVPEKGGGNMLSRRNRFGDEELTIDSLGNITARLTRARVQEVIIDLCERQRLNYYFLSPLNHETGVFVRDVDFGTLLDVLLAGTSSSYYIDNGIYIFGEAPQGEQLTSVQIVPMVSRAISKVDGAIPAGLRKNVTIHPFPDLNSMIVSGEQKQVSRVANFIKSIDQRVPMITIDVMIVDVTKSTVMEAGLGIGIGQGGKTTNGKLSPGVSMDLSAQSINSIIASFNGFGSLNLGRVTQQFYMDLKFLEENGVLQLRSTPKLSTLNGQEAILTSGETRHYKEITNNFIGSQNPTMTENFVWKSIDANLSVKIIPYVSRDETITLEIEIEQTEFMKGEVAEDAPPATSTRSFKSIIKVENEDMVLLGGIDRNTMEKSAQGLPFIARVPVLKWIFGKSKNSKQEQKLSVFIKPTVTY